MERLDLGRRRLSVSHTDHCTDSDYCDVLYAIILCISVYAGVGWMFAFLAPNPGDI